MKFLMNHFSVIIAATADENRDKQSELPGLDPATLGSACTCGN